MQYDITFNLCALINFTVILFAFYYKRNVPIPQNRMFSILIWVALGAAFFEIANVFSIEYAAKEPTWVVQLTSYVFFILHNLTIYIYALYILTLTSGSIKDTKNSIRFILFLPIVVDLILIAANPFTKGIFSYNEQFQYMKGKQQVILYAVAFYYLIYSVVHLTIFRKLISRYRRFALYSFVLMAGFTVGFQFLFPKYSVENFGVSICLMLIFLTIQKPEELLDPTTGAFNRDSFTNMAQLAFKNNIKFTVICVKLEDMAVLNKAFGSQNINNILKEIRYYFMKFGKREVYYLGTCCFGLLFKNLDQNRQNEIIDEINNRFHRTWNYEHVEVPLSKKICIIKCPTDAETAEKILEYSAYFAKLDYPDSNVIEAGELNIQDNDRVLKIEHCIQKAITNKSFMVYYQPIFSIKEQKFTSAEALVRLEDKEMGFISPEEFIPIAEQKGTILQIGSYVFETVCQFISLNHLKEKGIHYVEINLSVVQCMQEKLVDQLLEIMNRYRVSSDQINLEVTETAAVHSPKMLNKNIVNLHNRGISFSMDDYGTGYSNITSLIELPFDLIKFDKNFVWTSFENEKARIALNSTVKMIREMDLEIVAEGVETEEQARTLTEIGCSYLQGYYFSKPVPDSEFLELIDKQP